jgi:hypothetical protein
VEVVDMMAMVFWVLGGESHDISHHHLLLEIRAASTAAAGN